jgi:hypothetical protein
VVRAEGHAIFLLGWLIRYFRPEVEPDALQRFPAALFNGSERVVNKPCLPLKPLPAASL